MPFPREKCQSKIMQQHSNPLNISKASGDAQELEVKCVLRDKQNPTLEPLQIFGNYQSLSPRCSVSNQISRPHSFKTERTAAVINPVANSSSTISCVDYVTDNKDSFSRIPLRIKLPIASPRKRNSPIRKPGSNKIISHNFRNIAKLNYKELTTREPLTHKLEVQFQRKKKQIDHLRNDIFDKQKALSEMHENLVQLRKKLKISGKDIPMSNIDLLHYENGSNNHTEASIINSEIMQNANSTIQEICKFLMMKRLELVEVLEKISKDPANRNKLSDNTKSFEIEDQEKVDSGNPKDSENNSSFANQIKLLQEKLNNKEQKLAKVTTELEETQQKHSESSVGYEKIIYELKEQNKRLENELNQNQSKIQNYKEKTDIYEQHILSLKKRAKETDEKLRKAEGKCGELQKAIRY